jgi:hypothetical protein
MGKSEDWKIPSQPSEQVFVREVEDRVKDEEFVE